MGILKVILSIYGAFIVLFLSMIIGKFLIDYTFDIGLISGILLLPFTIGISIAPIILIAWFLES